MTSSVFFAVAVVLILFASGFVVAWLIFKTLEYMIKPAANSQINRPEREPDTAANLRVEVERTRLNAEALRLRTEELRLKALEAQFGARIEGVAHDVRDDTNHS